jgi:hypothetical protein
MARNLAARKTPVHPVPRCCRHWLKRAIGQLQALIETAVKNAGIDV